MFSTVPHNLHRTRRSALNPYFSAINLRKLEEPIQESISRLIAVFREHRARVEVISLRAAFAALTTDIITESCFSTTENYIEAPEFNSDALASLERGLDNLHFMIHCQWIVPLLKRLPEKLLVGTFGPGMATLLALQHVSPPPKGNPNK
jgi:cytochrome P450